MACLPSLVRSGTHSLQVLVVDDNRDSADSLALLMRLGGHQVDVAYNGSVALLLAEKNKPHVVLLDIGLPRVDGYQVVEVLRQRPETKQALIVAVTGRSSNEDRQRSLEAGFDLHLVKPIEIEPLLRFLKGDPTVTIE